MRVDCYLRYYIWRTRLIVVGCVIVGIVVIPMFDEFKRCCCNRWLWWIRLFGLRLLLRMIGVGLCCYVVIGPLVRYIVVVVFLPCSIVLLTLTIVPLLLLLLLTLIVVVIVALLLLL